jgi:hypothetical protein
MDDSVEVGTPVANACSYTVPFEYSIWTTTDHTCEASAAEIPAAGIPISAARVAAHKPRNSTFFTSFKIAGLGITSLLLRDGSGIEHHPAIKPARGGQRPLATVNDS